MSVAFKVSRTYVKRSRGVGVQFNETADGESASYKIGAIATNTLNAERPTHTM